VLACALDESVLWQTFARLVVPRIAEWCVLDVIEPAEEHRLTVFHRDPAMLEWTEELRLRGSRASEPWSPVARVLRTGVAEIYRGSALDRDAGIFARLGFECAMVVPVVARARVFGVATLVSAPPAAPFGPEELAMSQDLAHRMALAVGNARRARSRAAAPGLETSIESCPSLTG
jgi:GAF domain-containing protein